MGLNYEADAKLPFGAPKGKVGRILLARMKRSNMHRACS